LNPDQSQWFHGTLVYHCNTLARCHLRHALPRVATRDSRHQSRASSAAVDPDLSSPSRCECHGSEAPTPRSRWDHWQLGENSHEHISTLESFANGAICQPAQACCCFLGRQARPSKSEVIGRTGNPIVSRPTGCRLNRHVALFWKWLIKVGGRPFATDLRCVTVNLTVSMFVGTVLVLIDGGGLF